MWNRSAWNVLLGVRNACRTEQVSFEIGFEGGVIGVDRSKMKRKGVPNRGASMLKTARGERKLYYVGNDAWWTYLGSYLQLNADIKSSDNMTVTSGRWCFGLATFLSDTLTTWQPAYMELCTGGMAGRRGSVLDQSNLLECSHAVFLSSSMSPVIKSADVYCNNTRCQ